MDLPPRQHVSGAWCEVEGDHLAVGLEGFVETLPGAPRREIRDEELDLTELLGAPGLAVGVPRP